MKDRRTSKNAIFLVILLATSFVALSIQQESVSSEATVGDYLDFLVPTGVHIYVSCSNWSANDRSAIEGFLTTYLPDFYEQFWTINLNGYITIILQTTSPGYANGWISYDSNGNIIGINGTIGLPPNLNPNFPRAFLHELTHVFQFWIPNYFAVIGCHLEAVACAFVKIFSPSSDIYCGGELIHPSAYGQAQFIYALMYKGYNLNQAWEMLWQYDRLAFKKFNTYVASLGFGAKIGVREAVRNSLFEGNSDYCFNGYSLDDWLDGFSFYNSPSDVVEGTRLICWQGFNLAWYICFDAIAFLKQTNGTNCASVLSVVTYDIVVRDGYSGEILYSAINQTPQYPDWITEGFQPSSKHDLVKIDFLAHLAGGEDLPVAAYLTRSYDNGTSVIEGGKAIFFLNREGYAEGTGFSNVGPIDKGIILWQAGDNVEANVTWSKGTYTYIVNNFVAIPYRTMNQMAIRLYESKTFLSPFVQIADAGKSAQLQVHVSPIVSTGNLLLYYSSDNTNWTLEDNVKPENGYACFNVTFSQTGRHYFKASWTGDNVIDPSNSSSVRVDVPDTSPPVTVDNYDGLWHTSDFTINLTATDYSGTSGTYCRINGGTIQNTIVNGLPRITVEGSNNTLEYWSVDKSGNEELPHKILAGIKLDKTAPTGSILVENGAASTTTTSVILTLSASDTISGVTQMRFSNDGTTYSTWQAYGTATSWTLQQGEGAKTVYVQFKDNAGLTSTYSDTITLTTTPSPTPTPTLTPTPTPSPTSTFTSTPSPTPTSAPTPTATLTPTPLPILTLSPTPTPTPISAPTQSTSPTATPKLAPSTSQQATPTLQPNSALPTQIDYTVGLIIGIGVAVAATLIIKKIRK